MTTMSRPECSGGVDLFRCSNSSVAPSLSNPSSRRREPTNPDRDVYCDAVVLMRDGRREP